MKKFAKTLIAMSAMTAAGSASAGLFDCVNWIVGLDYYQSWRNTKRNLELFFPKSYPGATVYVGARFSDCVGLEFGYDTSQRKSKSWVIPAGTSINGVTRTSALSGSTSLRFYSLHLDLLGYLPLDCYQGLELFGAIGYGNNSGLRLGIGSNYMLTNIFGVRAKLGYESTTRLAHNSMYSSLGFSHKAFRYSTTVSLGAFIKF